MFPGRITYVAIIVCDNNRENNHNIWYVNSSDNASHLLPAKSLTEMPWNFENAQLNALRLKLSDQLGMLKDICHVKVGLQTLWNDAYQIIAEKVENNLIYGHSIIDDNVVIEENACKPLICNEHFAPLTKRPYTT